MKKMEQLANVKAFLCMVFGAYCRRICKSDWRMVRGFDYITHFYGSGFRTRIAVSQLLEKRANKSKKWGTEQ